MLGAIPKRGMNHIHRALRGADWHSSRSGVGHDAAGPHADCHGAEDDRHPGGPCGQHVQMICVACSFDGCPAAHGVCPRGRAGSGEPGKGAGRERVHGKGGDRRVGVHPGGALRCTGSGLAEFCYSRSDRWTSGRAEVGGDVGIDMMTRMFIGRPRALLNCDVATGRSRWIPW